MGYPNGPLLRVLAERARANLQFIDEVAPKWDPKSAIRDNPPYTDTQLLISTLGFFVFPHERTPGALGRLLKDYDAKHNLSGVITIKYPGPNTGKIQIADEDGEPVTIDPSSIEALPRLLRNSIAHFNVRPISTKDGRFGGVRVWNTDPNGTVTLVADLDFDQLRKLADFVLTSFSGARDKLEGLDDPEDPLEVLKKQKAQPDKPKMPKLNRDHWDAALRRNDNDPKKAKEWIDRVMAAAIKMPKK